MNSPSHREACLGDAGDRDARVSGGVSSMLSSLLRLLSLAVPPECRCSRCAASAAQSSRLSVREGASRSASYSSSPITESRLPLGKTYNGDMDPGQRPAAEIASRRPTPDSQKLHTHVYLSISLSVYLFVRRAPATAS
jgi:hypothetical protein